MGPCGNNVPYLRIVRRSLVLVRLGENASGARRSLSGQEAMGDDLAVWACHCMKAQSQGG